MTAYELELSSNLLKEKEKTKEGKNIAFKSEDQNEETSSDDDESYEEIALITEGLNFLRRKKAGRFALKGEGSRRIAKKEGTKSNPLKCFNCHEPGRFQNECPELKKEAFGKGKKKCFEATWDNSSDQEEGSDQEAEKQCFMANEVILDCFSNPKICCDNSFDEIELHD